MARGIVMLAASAIMPRQISVSLTKTSDMNHNCKVSNHAAQVAGSIIRSISGSISVSTLYFYLRFLELALVELF